MSSWILLILSMNLLVVPDPKQSKNAVHEESASKIPRANRPDDAGDVVGGDLRTILPKSTLQLVIDFRQSKNKAARRAHAAQLQTQLMPLITRAQRNPKYLADILPIQAEVFAALKNAPMVKRSMQNLVALQRKARKASDYEEWLDRAIVRHQNRLEPELAVSLIDADLLSRELSVRRVEIELRKGDILAQQALMNKTPQCNKAIEQYSETYKRYKNKYRELAEDALLRKIRILWRNGRIEEARNVCIFVRKFGTVYAGEYAAHFPELKGHPKVSPEEVARYSNSGGE